MAALDHWHPVLAAQALRRQPVGVRLAGVDLVLFRTASGRVGAVHDMCPHRRMKLSLGSVVGEQLQCSYHGWTFNVAGEGQSPGSPKLHACVTAYDTCERHGYVWVKSRGSDATFPGFDDQGWFLMCRTDHIIGGPLELVLDNFTEVEHTSMAHEIFGYDLSRMHEVKEEFAATETTVSYQSSGPAKAMPAHVRLLLGVGKTYHFTDRWTTHFSPVHAVFEHAWSDPASGAPARVGWRARVFFVPVDPGRTRVVTFLLARSSWPLPASGGLGFFRGFARRQTDREIRRDAALVEGLASHETSLAGLKLSRFDRNLAANRDRIASLYHGVPNQLRAKIPPENP